MNYTSAVGGLFAHLKEAERELDTAREKTPVAVEHTAIGECVSGLARKTEQLTEVF